MLLNSACLCCPVLGGVVTSTLVQRDAASEDSYDYGMVLASSRSHGIDFWGKSMFSRKLALHLAAVDARAELYEHSEAQQSADEQLRMPQTFLASPAAHTPRTTL